MTIGRVLLVASIALFATTSVAHNASAALISKFTYTVTGGQFNGFRASGPITGGSFSVTPASPVQTPGSFASGTLQLTLSGPSGFFQFVRPHALRLVSTLGYALATPLAFAVSESYPAGGSITGPLFFSGISQSNGNYANYFATAHRVQANYAPSAGQGIVGFSIPSLCAQYPPPTRCGGSHSFTLGNEVRTVVPEPTTVGVDIKPGSERDPINPKSRGIIPVAVLGSGTVDVADVDLSTLAFGPDGAPLADERRVHLVDVNGDGFTDLLGHFRTQETGIASGDEEACLTGETLDSAPFEGCDSVRTIPPN